MRTTAGIVAVLLLLGTMQSSCKPKQAPPPSAPAESAPTSAAPQAVQAGPADGDDPVAARAAALAEELSAEATDVGIGAEELKGCSTSWLRDTEGFIRTAFSLSAEQAAELGLPQSVLTDFTQDEIQRYGSKNFKCPSVPGTYLDLLPTDGSQVLECYRKLAGGGRYVQGFRETDTAVLAQTRFVGGAAYWERLHWQPIFQRWDSLQESDRLRERRLTLEKQFGVGKQIEAVQAYYAKKGALSGNPHGLKRAFLEAHKPRIIYELAGLKLQSLP
ncbi:MAG: hypothetical protein HY924_01995 [Elusimicrobia bacterium]|nr:hypothetical protein [Elusimicrobiota bacterium]